MVEPLLLHVNTIICVQFKKTNLGYEWWFCKQSIKTWISGPPIVVFLRPLSNDKYQKADAHFTVDTDITPPLPHSHLHHWDFDARRDACIAVDHISDGVICREDVLDPCTPRRQTCRDTAYIQFSPGDVVVVSEMEQTVNISCLLHRRYDSVSAGVWTTSSGENQSIAVIKGTA